MKIGFTESNIIMVYIVGVLVTAILTNSQICWIASSVLSVILFNFMFTFPHFSLVAYGEGYPITFAVMLIVSLITGSISNKMKSQVKKSTETAYRTKILFDANQLIQNAKNDEEIIKICLEYGLECKGTVFSTNPQKLSESIKYVRENYGDALVQRLIVVQSPSRLKEILPYFEEHGYLEGLLKGTLVLSLTLEVSR